MNREEIDAAFRLRCINAATLKGEFILSSGDVTDEYFDCQRILASNADRSWVVEKIIRSLDMNKYNLIAGVSTGGIPWATLIAQRCGIGLIYVRNIPKGHGTLQAVEGQFEVGDKVLLVDDVLTTGKSVRMAETHLKAQRLFVLDLVVIKDVILS